MWSQLVLGGHVGCCQVLCWGDDCLSKCWSWKKFLKQVETLLLPFTKELKVVTGVRRSQLQGLCLFYCHPWLVAVLLIVRDGGQSLSRLIILVVFILLRAHDFLPFFSLFLFYFAFFLNERVFFCVGSFFVGMLLCVRCVCLFIL